MQPRFKGPLVIVKILPSDTYKVQNLNTKGSAPRTDTNAHVSQIKIWRGFIDDVNDVEVNDTSSDSNSEDESPAISTREQIDSGGSCVENCSEDNNKSDMSSYDNIPAGRIIEPENNIEKRTRKREQRLPGRFADFII